MSDVYGRRSNGAAAKSQQPVKQASPAAKQSSTPAKQSAAVKQPSPAKPADSVRLNARHADPAAAVSRNHVSLQPSPKSMAPPPAAAASSSPSRPRETSRLRTRSAERTSASPGRSSSAYARSASGLSSTSRYDAVSNRLRMEEDLWSQHVEGSARHRQAVRERAQQLEEESKRRARETLQQEMDRSRECINANQQAFQRHVERSHELQALRQEHVDRQAASRRQWELQLAKTNEERTEEAERRHLADLARKREETHVAVETRMMSAKDRLSHLERARQQQLQAKEQRDSEAARAAYRSTVRRRQEQLEKHRAETNRVLTVVERAKIIEKRRIAEQLAKERETERRSMAAQRAHAESIARRQERKVQADEEARVKRELAEKRDAARRAEFEAHFEETLAVGDETSMHNKRVARTSTKWF